jgi:hypothetical protein
MKVDHMLALACSFVLLLAACVPLPGPGSPGTATPGGNPAPPHPTGTPVAAATAARVALASRLGVTTDQVAIVSTEQVEWSDACLGAAAEGELCAQVITPGYRIVLEANGQEHEVHTDESGRRVRFVTP